MLRKLRAQGAEWVQLDEPVFALDLTSAQRAALTAAYGVLSQAAPGLNLLVANYFGSLQNNLSLFAGLPVQALHVDLVRGAADLEPLLRALGPTQSLSLGVVDGRNIWRTDYDRVFPLIDRAVQALGHDRVWLAPSCSLLHVPVTLRHETKLDRDLLAWLSFAEEKLGELRELSDLSPAALAANRAAHRSRRASSRIHRADVKTRAAGVRPEDFRRRSPFEQRQARKGRVSPCRSFPRPRSAPSPKRNRSARRAPPGRKARFPPRTMNVSWRRKPPRPSGSRKSWASTSSSTANSAIC